MLSMVYCFFLGICEFRSDVTSVTGQPDAYDLGREFAHRVTFRWFEQ